MDWVFLGMAAVIYVLSCWLTFASSLKDRWWYIPLGMLLGIVLNGVWFWAAKTFGDKNKMYAFSLTWDALMMMIFYTLPLLLFGAKLDRTGWFALGLIVIGAIILKLNQNLP